MHVSELARIIKERLSHRGLVEHVSSGRRGGQKGSALVTEL